MSDLADACEAHYPGDYPATLPYFVDDTKPPSLVAYYLCWCGRAWRCWWDAESAGWPTLRTDAA